MYDFYSFILLDVLPIHAPWWKTKCICACVALVWKTWLRGMQKNYNDGKSPASGAPLMVQ